MSAARRVIRREIRGARSARCNSEILSSLIIQPNTIMNTATSSSHGNITAAAGVGSSCTNLAGPTAAQSSGSTKGYALVLPSSTLTAPIGSKNNGGLERPRSAAHLPPVAATAAAAPTSPAPPRSPVTNANPPHSPFYLYMADVPRNRHYESLESLQHAFTNMTNNSNVHF